MDDLYGNAWGEYNNTGLKEPDTETSWNAQTSPAVVQEEQEVQERLPGEWSPEPPAQWATSDIASSKPPLWASQAASDIWGASSQPIPPDSPSPPLPTSPPSPNISESHEHDITVQVPTSPSRSSTPEGFGTFESGDHHTVVAQIDDDGWGSSLPTFDSSDVSSPWVQEVRGEIPVEDVQDDEWEAAKREKEKLDKKVPPEVLSGLIGNFHDFAQETWPGTKRKDEGWMQGWRSGLESVEGLDVLVNKVIPERAFSPRVRFGKTAIAKDMAKSLRLSKNLPLTRISPMSHFMSSRGSSSDWEAAIKSRSDIIPDDMPVGWRIIEKQEEPVVTHDTKAKKSGIFSFWGRRDSISTRPSTPPSDPKPPSTTDTSHETPLPTLPPPAPSLPETKLMKSQSPRSSLEGRKSAPIVEKAEQIKAAIPTSSLDPAPAEPKSDPLDFFTPEPAPSAVSRFWNRFSRPKESPRDSMAALSSDDLDFLSDVIPSAMDDLDEDDLPLAQKKLATNNDRFPHLPPIRPSSTTGVGSNASMSQTISVDDEFSSFFDTPAPTKPVMKVAEKRTASTATNDLFPSKPTPHRSGTASLTASKSTRATTTLSPGVADQNPLAAFMLPPPPSSRSQTPARFPPARMGSADHTAPVPFLIPPPPSSSSSRSSTPVPSSPKKPPTLLAPDFGPKSSQSFAPKPFINTFDDEEFSDFLSSGPASARPLYANQTPSVESQFLSTPIADKNSLISGTSPIGPDDNSDFDDFDDFISPAVQSVQESPQPPTPPAKPARSNLPTSTSQRRKADHSHTMSLLESAAARKGQWPAPPPPSVQAIIPPPLPSVMSNTTFSLLGSVDERSSAVSTPTKLQQSVIGPSENGDGIGFINVNSTTMLPLLQKPPPPSTSINVPQFLMDFGPSSNAMVASKPQPPSAKQPVNGGQQGTGGLSAQDLSFFEGL